MGYPRLLIYPEVIKKNGRILYDLCAEAGIEAVAVIKGFNALPPFLQALWEGGFRCFSSSRIAHLEEAKKLFPTCKTMLRIPMLSELAKMLQHVDISLHSEAQVLEALNQEALRQQRRHQVILMRDLGDLREGIFCREKLYLLASQVESMEGLDLLGIGTNLTCYGSIIPTEKNLGELVEDALEIEKRIGRKLEVVSGGNTSSLPLLIRGGMPKGISQLRIGEALTVPCDLIDYWKSPLPGLSNAALILEAEIVEIGEKPTFPIGEKARNAFGYETTYVDRGLRNRAILALGLADIGDENKLIPEDAGVDILGASSDHLIVDIQNSEQSYKLGDIMRFQLRYKSMLFSCASTCIENVICE
ncbi:MAG: alanine racemase [Bacillota bacterium]|nr:alanine racemase [Bacillota bacterium]